jgi:hypothetical protein
MAISPGFLLAKTGLNKDAARSIFELPNIWQSEYLMGEWQKSSPQNKKGAQRRLLLSEKRG